MSRLLASAMLALWGLVSCARPAEHRIVFELTSDEPQAWSSILNNVENAQKALGHATIEVVAHGRGLDMLRAEKNAEVLERLSALASRGVIFAACQNTMKKQGVTQAMLSPFVTTVDSGVAEVVRKQEAGWSYLRNAP